MRRIVWLASYPKSGNTWLRLLITASRQADVDINKISGEFNIASARGTFDHRLLVDSSLMTHDEIERLRPHVYEEIVREADPDDEDADAGAPVHFVKVHDAYTRTRDGTPVLAGARGAEGAILVVRDPRDVAASLANHLHIPLDQAIAFMRDPAAGFCTAEHFLPPQLRQRLLGWSRHAASWLEQGDIPVHPVRYEDMKRRTAPVFAAAMRFADLPIGDDAIARAIADTAFDKLQAQERATGFKEWNGKQSKGTLFFRRGESGGWRDELSAAQVRQIEDDHGAMMTRLGYDLSA